MGSRPAVAHHPHGDAVRYLLPAIPTVLYGGLGRHCVERLSVMRTACKSAPGSTNMPNCTPPLDFMTSFSSGAGVRHVGRRVRDAARADELIGQMSELLGIGYDVLALDLTESEKPPPGAGPRPDATCGTPALALPSPTAGTPPPRA